MWTSGPGFASIILIKPIDKHNKIKLKKRNTHTTVAQWNQTDELTDRKVMICSKVAENNCNHWVWWNGRNNTDLSRACSCWQSGKSIPCHQASLAKLPPVLNAWVNSHFPQFKLGHCQAMLAQLAWEQGKSFKDFLCLSFVF